MRCLHLLTYLPNLNLSLLGIWALYRHTEEAQPDSLGWAIVIKHRHCDVMKALTRIVLENKNAGERNDALNLQKVLQTFEFVLILVVLTNVLSAINGASMCLQSKDADLLKATHRLKTAFEEVSDYHNKFSDAVVEATRMCRRWSIEAKFKDTCVARKKRHFDELAEDSHLINAEQRFWITVFNYLIDTVTTQITQKFTAMNSLY